MFARMMEFSTTIFSALFYVSDHECIRIIK